MSPHCAQCWQFYLLSSCQETPCSASSAQRSSSGKRCSWLPRPCAVRAKWMSLPCQLSDTGSWRGRQRQDRHLPSKDLWICANMQESRSFIPMHALESSRFPRAELLCCHTWHWKRLLCRAAAQQHEASPPRLLLGTKNFPSASARQPA